MNKTWTTLDLGKLLLQLGEDLDREGLRGTPERVERAWFEFLEGYTLDAEKILSRTFTVESQGLQFCRNIGFTSMCEHHLLPFFGVCHIGYVPSNHVTGLSKLSRLVDCYAKRLQIQERLTQQIADALWDHLKPVSVLVVVSAKHLCCHGRGIRRSQMSFVTSATHGRVDVGFYQLLLGG